MLRLYYAAMTSAFRCRWALEEAGLPHELVRLSLARAEHKSADYLKVHPLGSIPALVDGDQVVLESAAICMYVGEKDPERRLVPAEGTIARAHYYQWILFSMTNLDSVVHGPYLRAFPRPPELRRGTATDDERAALRRYLDLVGDRIAGGWILGEQFTVADIVLGGLLEWADTCGQLRGATVAEAYLARLRQRPAFQRAAE
ncbi:glutathione S-transferase family protein [Nannocystis bainbridge]|uniref:Glutathione S-transferase family protein n=1 Tax=Nannocystis bainbridge TaxID=2995303 RepID=A0ABT5EBQ3_9BACT|nr:glutathione S-transferase family protein [Nannocystis bainbridge]MDC0722863.1 glutathione S-transferase family protein [Nannocystis bainbridge]